MMPEARNPQELLHELQRVANAAESGDFSAILDVGRLPRGEWETALLFNRILSENRAGSKKNENDRQEMLKSILNGMEALICVCDAENFEILFLNDSIRKNFGLEGDCVGQLCHKTLQGLDEPCGPCPYRQLHEEPDKTLTWEHREAVKGQTLRKTARLIDWPGGRKAHLEYAIDITEVRNAQEALEYREKMLDVLNRVAILLLSQSEETFEKTLTEGSELIADIVNVDRISLSRNIEHPDGLCAFQIYRWNRDIGSAHTAPELQNNPYDQHIPRWKEVLSSGECINGPVRLMPEADVLKPFGCLTILAIPVFDGGTFWGFVLFEDLGKERVFTEDEVGILRSASFMLANTVIRNKETKKIRKADEQLKEMVREVEHQNRLLHMVNRVSAILLQSNVDTFESDLLRSMGIMAQAVDADRAYIWKNEVVDGELYCDQIYEWSEGAEPQQDKDFLRGIRYRDAMPSWEKAFLQGNCFNGLVRDLPANESDILTRQGILSILVVPIYLKEQFWGFVGFDDCRNERVFSENEEKILRSASELIANALIRNSMEESILHLETEVDQIYYDPLTGIYNRRFLDKNLNRIIPSLARSGSVLSLLMVDIDYFKRYNDTYGHSEGDNCLKIVAETLRDSITRTEDFVARYGGEEFAVVLPNTGEIGANMVANRILENIRKCGIPHERSDAASCVTVSIGATTGKVEYTHSADDYVRRADEMLYQAKRDGRNRYVFARLYDRLPDSSGDKEYANKLSNALASITKPPVLASGILEDAAKVITKMGCHALGTHKVGVWLTSKDARLFKNVVSYNNATKGYTIQDDFDLSNRTEYVNHLKSERVLVIHDADQPNPLANLTEAYGPDMCALLDAPIRIGGELAGVVCIDQNRCEQYPQRREWTIEEQNFASSLADLMALAITSAELQSPPRTA